MTTHSPHNVIIIFIDMFLNHSRNNQFYLKNSDLNDGDIILKQSPQKITVCYYFKCFQLEFTFMGVVLVFTTYFDRS